MEGVSKSYDEFIKHLEGDFLDSVARCKEGISELRGLIESDGCDDGQITRLFDNLMLDMESIYVRMPTLDDDIGRAIGILHSIKR